MPDIYTLQSMPFPLPPDVAAEIGRASEAVAAVGGRVCLTVSVAEYSTWWAAQHRGRKSQTIEFTPEIRIETKAKSACASLVCHHNDRGLIWASADMVRRMLAWVLSPDEVDGVPDHLSSPLTDAEIELLRGVE